MMYAMGGKRVSPSPDGEIAKEMLCLVWPFSTVLNQLVFASEIEASETPNK